tara:strand:- start:100 stop:585 length:486 start_codon:yes stop_codon:yes gene_type:complete
MIDLFYFFLVPSLLIFSLYYEGSYYRRFSLFFFGSFLGIFLLSFGPDNRLKQHFIAYLDYFDMNKRVIYHLKNSKTIFSSQAECQLIYHDLNKDQIMKLLDGGKVDFKRSIKNPNPCQLFFVTNILLDNNLTVAFELCQIVEKTTTVLYFQINDESVTCLD